MTPETLAALEASIARWHEKSEMAKTDEGFLEISLEASDCPLCLLEWPSCAPCSVYLTTGTCDCRGTPYSEACRAQRRVDEIINCGEFAAVAELEIARSVFRSAARREIRFLTSLLPPAATRDDIVGEAGLGWGRAA